MQPDPGNARTPLDALTLRVTGYFRKHAAQYALNPQTVEARYILNWGGFVNVSFALTDGQKTFHLKLADDAEMQSRLARWKSVGPRLAEKYHAPPVLDWIAIPRTPFAGLLFESIPGQPADLAAQPRVLAQVLALLTALHADQDLAAALESIDGEIFPCAETFLSVYIDRFDEDLLSIVGDLPPFVPLSLLDWMMGETRELEGLARDLPAFQQPAGAPIHSDLWPGNILVTPDERFFIIDWDDLFLGDPALDYSILLGPLLLNGPFRKNDPFRKNGALSQTEIEHLLPGGADFRERFNLYLRALLLDQVIDSLADWVEAAFAPQHQSDLRSAKERAHQEALALYRQLYP